MHPTTHKSWALYKYLESNSFYFLFTLQKKQFSFPSDTGSKPLAATGEAPIPRTSQDVLVEIRVQMLDQFHEENASTLRLLSTRLTEKRQNELENLVPTAFR